MSDAISVFIPSYNQAGFLRESVCSALEQCSVCQVLVLDDKSTDSSLSVLRTLEGIDSRLCVVSQDSNRGIPGNIDEGLRATKGDFIFRLDADDRLLRGGCESLAKALRQHPEAGTAHGQIWEINQAGERVRPRRLARKSGFQDARTALIEAAKGYRVAANLLMFRREALASVDFLVGRPCFAEDYHLYAALAAAGWGNVYVDADIGEYRSYSNSTRAARKANELRGLRAVFDEVLSPAYRTAGLSESKLREGRKRLANSQSRYLLEVPKLPVADEVELVRLLAEIHPTPLPQIYRLARQCRLGPVLQAWFSARQMARSSVQSIWPGLKSLIQKAR